MTRLVPCEAGTLQSRRAGSAQSSPRVTITGKTVGGKDWYQLPEAWATGAGLLDGLDIEVRPCVDCPRCDVVLFLYRELAK